MRERRRYGSSAVNRAFNLWPWTHARCTPHLPVQSGGDCPSRCPIVRSIGLSVIIEADGETTAGLNVTAGRLPQPEPRSAY